LSREQRWSFEYAGLPDEGATEPPHIWISVRGPSATIEYPCLLDSGSSFSAFPVTVASELGVDPGLLDPTRIRTVKGMAHAKHLRRSDRVAVCLDQANEIAIAPYFLPPEVIEEEEFESEYYILGRDFFLPLVVTFFQAAERVEFALA